MTEPGHPYDPKNPDGEPIVSFVKVRDLLPYVDTSGGVQLEDREGVWAHSFKCRRCTLHFVLFSWSATRHTPETISCPECHATGAFLHRIIQLSGSRSFDIGPDREPEIFDVWPFRLR